MRRLLGLLLRVTFVTHILRFINRKKVTILMLHGVAGDHPDAGWEPLWPRMSPARLDLVMQQLSEFYQFISLADAVDIVAGRKPPIRNALVLTFDDGYRNNVLEALPVLDKYAAPATFYIASGFVETGRSFWIDRLDYALQMAPQAVRLIEAEGQAFDLRDLDRASLSEGYRRLRLHIKARAKNDEAMLKQFDSISSALESKAASAIVDVIDSDPFASVVTWNQLAEAGRAGVEIGSHTVDHLRLTAVPAGTVERQLVDSREEIADRTGQNCSHFCYPNGDFDGAVARQVRDAGYESAVTTSKGLNQVGHDLMTLRRFPMPGNTDAFNNLLAISGFAELPVIRRLVARMQ
jgi:peptidoglycan/xylan/chitin deacetylase (PgdA/CDA1 family)